VKRGKISALQDAVAVEEPLEIQLVYGAIDDRKVKSSSTTMQTPGNDNELAAGFLMTEAR
jgi:FdhD protein